MQDLVTNWPNLVRTANPQPAQGLHPVGVNPHQAVAQVQQPIHEEGQPHHIQQGAPQLAVAPIVAPHQAVAQQPSQQAQHLDHTEGQEQVGHEEQEVMSLEGWVRPDVPPALPQGPSTQGWEAIRRLGGWQAFLVDCPMLDEVPEQHKGAWCVAWVESLKRWKTATTDYEKETALL